MTDGSSSPSFVPGFVNEQTLQIDQLISQPGS